MTLSTVADLSLPEFTAYALASDVALDLVIGSVRQIATQTLAALAVGDCIKGLEEKKRFSDQTARAVYLKATNKDAELQVGRWKAAPGCQEPV